MPGVTLDEFLVLARRALTTVGVAEWAREPFLRSLHLEISGDGGQGPALERLIGACEAAETGALGREAIPVVERPADAVVTVDAAGGLADAAIEAGAGELVPLVRRIGVALLRVEGGRFPPPLAVPAGLLRQEGLVVLHQSAAEGAALVLVASTACLSAGIPAQSAEACGATGQEDRIDLPDGLGDRLRQWV